MDIQENVSLQPYNTLAIPVNSRWFTTVINHEQLMTALAFVRRQQCALLVLGGGSNVVLTEHFSGLTLHLQNKGFGIESETDNDILLSVAAGENWHDLVMYCVNQGWYGIENLALIPGCVGAAPIQNIGAYGVELTDCFSYLEAVDIVTGDIMKLDKAACEFAYRDSVFKHQLKDKVIITRVVLRLYKQPRYCLDYPALKNYLTTLQKEPSNITVDGNSYNDKNNNSALSSLAIAEVVIAIRRSKLPDPKVIPNAGSFFKNPIVSVVAYQRLHKQYPAIVAFPQTTVLGDITHYKLAAGWLIDQAGWKGKQVDGINMHEQQALVLTNPNQKNGRMILRFVEQLQNDIDQRYGITLEIEPRVYQSAT